MEEQVEYTVIVTFKEGHEAKKKYYYNIVNTHTDVGVLALWDKDGDSFMVPIANIDNVSVIKDE